MPDNHSFDLLAKDIEYIKKAVDDLKSEMQSGYVTRAEFDPIQKLVYGLVSLILVSVVGALVGLVVIR